MTWTIHRFTTDTGSPDHLDGARRLMDVAFDEFSDDDWDHAVGGHHVVAVADGAVIAHAAVVRRVLTVADEAWRTGYVEAVATHPDWRRRGVGAEVMRALADAIHAHHDLGALSTGTAAFYLPLGWERWQGPTFVRRGDALDRTPADDDGVMVLRFGASALLDLTAPIACEARSGDDW